VTYVPKSVRELRKMDAATLLLFQKDVAFAIDDEEKAVQYYGKLTTLYSVFAEIFRPLIEDEKKHLEEMTNLATKIKSVINERTIPTTGNPCGTKA